MASSWVLVSFMRPQLEDYVDVINNQSAPKVPATLW